MREERLCWRIPVEAAILDAERPAEKPARAGRIDDEARANAERLSLPRADEQRIAVRLPVDALELDEILVLNAERDRLVHQKVIDVAPQPVRVGQLVARDWRPRAADSPRSSAAR